MQNISKSIFKSSSALERKEWVVESLHNSLPFIYAAISIFVLGIILGFLNPETFKPFYDKILAYAQFRLTGKGIFLTFLFIFLHNSTAAIINIFLGAMFGLLPVISSFINGAVLGTFASYLVNSEKALELFLIIPHGMFELPAMFIAWGTGIWIGTYLFRKNRTETFQNRRIRATLLIAYIIPLLLCAAIIETGTVKLLSATGG